MSEQTPQSAIFAFADESSIELAESNPLFARGRHTGYDTCCRTLGGEATRDQVQTIETSSNLRQLDAPVNSIGSRRP